MTDKFVIVQNNGASGESSDNPFVAKGLGLYPNLFADYSEPGIFSVVGIPDPVISYLFLMFVYYGKALVGKRDFLCSNSNFGIKNAELKTELNLSKRN